MDLKLGEAPKNAAIIHRFPQEVQPGEAKPGLRCELQKR